MASALAPISSAKDRPLQNTRGRNPLPRLMQGGAVFHEKKQGAFTSCFAASNSRVRRRSLAAVLPKLDLRQSDLAPHGLVASAEVAVENVRHRTHNIALDELPHVVVGTVAVGGVGHGWSELTSLDFHGKELA